jgi:putative protease
MERGRKKLPELLAPAGGRQAFLGAVKAGADAVYLGGEKFGARAYAENFRP